MNKITIKGKSFDLIGSIIEIGNTLNFKAQNLAAKDVDITSLKGLKIISSFPDINTSICDQQTRDILDLAKKYPHLNFISITTDEIDTINKWCGANGFENVQIWSDHKYKDFGHKTNTLIKEIDKLARGFLVLDQTNKIIASSYETEIAKMPNFDILQKYLK